LAERLVGDGAAAVLLGRDPLPAAIAQALPNSRTLVGDLRSVGVLEAALDGVTAVVHLAAVTAGPVAEAEDPASVVDVNVGGTAAVLHAAAKAGIARVVIASSVAVYGIASTAPDGLHHENGPTAPVSLYGVTKLAAEAVASRLADRHGLDMSIVRIGPVHGPWEHASGQRETLSPHAQALALARAGRDLVLPRAAAGDWLYARDAAAGLAAVLGAAPTRRAHRVVNLGGGATTPLAWWLAGLATRYRVGVAIDPDRATIRLHTAADRAPMSIARIAADIGWCPGYPADAALADWLAWADRWPAWPALSG
jgi:nucleoside-diphosphate-sugar epimerase